METLEIYKTRKDEIVEQTIELLPDALSGDPANRTFYFRVDESGNLTVDYYYYAGQIKLDDECFYTIRNFETPDPEEYGYKTIAEMDFDACGYRDQIGNAIDNQIALLE